MVDLVVHNIDIFTDFGNLQFWTSSLNTHLPERLYSDKTMKLADFSLPQPVNKYILCCLYPYNDQTRYQSAASFLSYLYLDDLVCQAYEETGEHIYYVYYCKIPSVNNFLVLRISINELWVEQSESCKYLKEILHARIWDIKMKTRLNYIYDNYNKYFQNLATHIVSQNQTIIKLTSDLGALKSIKVDSEKQDKTLLKENLTGNECIICFVNPKNIVFIPCGHVAVCLNCMDKHLKIRINMTFKKKADQIDCILCKKKVKEAREIFI
jgi:Zinc finger, C3HC4 type (RING finger)